MDILESSVSCIDLVFALYFSKKLVTNSIFNLKACYPPPYEGSLWKYKGTNGDLLNRAMGGFYWENKLYLIGIKNQVVLFNEAIVNIISNFLIKK